MKIVIIGTVASSILGFRRSFIEKLVKRGHLVYTFACDFDDGSMASVKAIGATPVRYSLSRTGLNPARDVFDTYKLSAKIRDIKPDLVFSYFAKPVVYGTLAAFFAGVKRRIGMLEGLGYVFTDYEGGNRWQHRLLRVVQACLFKLTIPLLQKIVFLNPDDPKDLLKRYKIRARHISVLGGIGVPLEKFPYSIPNVNRISFLFVGRLLAEKGIYEFLRAAEKVKALYPSAEFIVLGTVDRLNPGSLKQDELEAFILAGVVIYPGQVNNVPEWISRSSVFVLPSYYREGVPRSTQEAMAVGRPVITCDTPGCRETVVEGVNGFLIPRWSVSALVEKMIYFLDNPHLIIEMGRASHEIALKKFDSLEVDNRLIGVLEDEQ
ncbi:Glycosyltransferase involved in cell wall bisynthesis [Pseudomonas gessardii]|uniref:glycosyltransferase family 4 protein n=1 Tax=Pseudomonas gessardii TaxID=78544 RepID=UPI00088C59A2|nr:glycosyltransferase family 4 protein [Pseudomonas gessardii]MRU53742.1 glycosyltransferase family 4 protein [Pseudomonas gessardii]ONH37904.1 glycosyltransferase family 1 protein [Pseudomonas gessardii]SDQ72698.1 Glycosyltransferase involved in cell wall bisynthesis [Pseudomonas gessardii]